MPIYIFWLYQFQVAIPARQQLESTKYYEAEYLVSLIFGVLIIYAALADLPVLC